MVSHRHRRVHANEHSMGADVECLCSKRQGVGREREENLNVSFNSIGRHGLTAHDPSPIFDTTREEMSQVIGSKKPDEYNEQKNGDPNGGSAKRIGCFKSFTN